jgi:signal transduction histidine kinase
MLSLVLTSAFPMCIWWGPDLIQFYNDGFRPFLGSRKHPTGMGQRARDCWSEIWDALEPYVQRVRAGGTTYVQDGLLLLDRSGFREEAYFTYAFSPIRDEHGGVAGIFVAGSESTEKVIGERRLKLLSRMGEVAEKARSTTGACHAMARIFASAVSDLPVSLVYLLEPGGEVGQLVCASGLPPGHPAAVDRQRLRAPDAVWPFAAALSREVAVDAGMLHAHGADLPGGPWPDGATCAVVLPLPRVGHGVPFGFLVTGVSPRLRLDAAYRDFLRLVSGHVTNVIFNARAGEEQRRAQAEREGLLRQVDAARARLHDLVENAPVIVCTLRGPQHIIELVNPLFQRSAGGERALEGRPVRDVPFDVVGQGFLEVLDRIYATGDPYVRREVLIRFDKHGDGLLEDAFFTYVYQPTHDALGRVDGIDVFGFEVTEQVRARQNAELLAEEARRRAEFEQHLMGIVSHDLRNPLNAILLSTRTLLRLNDLGTRQMQSLVRIQTSAERATRLIRDLLDFTQARLGGGIRIEPQPVDLHDLVANVAEEIEAAWPGRSVTLAHSGDGRGEWDADRLGQVVQNMVTNALKYSPEDSPVEVETRGEGETVALVVHNQGQPILPERRERLFEPFQRAGGETGASRSVGLGLYIVSQVVRAHGGSVHVHSTDTEGTTFIVRLPRYPASRSPVTELSGR